MTFWIALAVLLVAVVVGIAFAVLRGLQLWRNVKRSSASLTGELERISEATARSSTTGRGGGGMRGDSNSAGERLAVSRAQLDIQLAAVREARAQVRRTFWFVPGI